MDYSEKVSTDNIIITDEFKNILSRIENSDDNFFITGNAGTGKSTLIDLFRKKSLKRVVVLAPTGLAANNVRGQTIHSFFRFPPKLMTGESIKSIKVYGDIYRKIDTIVIDEASMVRADLLDAIDIFLRQHAKDPFLPFGGVQIVLVGDLHQLPPVVTNEDRMFITDRYDSPYFFSAISFNDSFNTIELTHIFRQEDEKFIEVLNKIRKGQFNASDLDYINSRVADDAHPHSVTLSSINRIADSINNHHLNRIDSASKLFIAESSGEINENENNIRIPIELELKKGARVMFTRNSEDWVNGSLGEVVDIDGGIIVKLDDGDEVNVLKESWEKIKYNFNPKTEQLEEEVVWSMKQYPLRLAYAITIHKSQGMTFNNININLTRAPFAHGQAYVALSRSKSLQGLHISRPLSDQDIIVDPRVSEFLQ